MKCGMHGLIVLTTGALNSAVDQCIPKKKKRKNRRAPRILCDVLKLARRKKYSYKKGKSSDIADLWCEYKNINNMLKKKCNEAGWGYKALSSNVLGKNK